MVVGVKSALGCRTRGCAAIWQLHGSHDRPSDCRYRDRGIARNCRSGAERRYRCPQQQSPGSRVRKWSYYGWRIGVCDSISSGEVEKVLFEKTGARCWQRDCQACGVWGWGLLLQCRRGARGEINEDEDESDNNDDDDDEYDSDDDVALSEKFLRYEMNERSDIVYVTISE